jgi:hypothetical protein
MTSRGTQWLAPRWLVHCFWNVMAHAQKPDFVLLRLKCDGTCAETIFRLTAFEMWWHMRKNQISSYCVLNVTVHAQKADFVFRRNGRIYLNWPGGGLISVDYWQAKCAHQPARFVLLVKACFLQSCDVYWLPTPFSCFHFTSPPVRHRVPSHFKCSLTTVLKHNQYLHSVIIQPLCI